VAAYCDKALAGWKILSGVVMGFGKIIIGLGILLVFLGIAMTYAPWLVNWFGRLPGDIRVQNKNGILFFPIVSMLVISIVLSIVINLFKK
jgi:uncharacterized membrane protein required for colicin V production